MPARTADQHASPRPMTGDGRPVESVAAPPHPTEVLLARAAAARRYQRSQRRSG